jgi:hypothetical protein
MSLENVTGVRLDQLETLLQRRLVGWVNDLRLELHGREVVLRGWTRTYYAKQIAQHVVMESGLQILANEIEVR